MSGPPSRASWALAYILQDWKRRGAVQGAYRLAALDDERDPTFIRPSAPTTVEAMEVARSRLLVYVRILDDALGKTIEEPDGHADD